MLLIASICGGIGQSIAGYSLGGCFVSIIVGFIGAWIGPMIARELDLPMFYTMNIQGREFPFVWSIIGSAVFALIIGLITKGRKQN
ncbi:MAG: GlsB/YeaQ/YmgE family stress response membrane protein [Melioribacteraceae bacterium]